MDCVASRHRLSACLRQLRHPLEQSLQCRLEREQRALRVLPGVARPTHSTVVRALRRADRVAGRPLPRVRRATACLWLGARRRRVCRGCTALRPRLEGARPPPRRRPGCRARGRARHGTGSGRHRVYPGGRWSLPGSRPPPGRAPRALSRARMGSRGRAAPHSSSDDPAAGRSVAGRATAKRSRSLPGGRGSAGESRARRRRLHDGSHVRRRRLRSPRRRSAPHPGDYLRPRRALG